MRVRSLVATAIMLASSAAMAQGESEWKSNMMGQLERSYVFAGIGVGNYSQDLGDFTDAGLAWQARAGVQPWSFLGAEIQYQGLNSDTASIVQNGVLQNNGTLTQTQFTANVTAGVPVTLGNQEFIPYALLGAGYARLSASREAKAVGLDDDNTFALPIAIGASYDITDRFVLDGRATYNVLFGVDQPIANNDGDAWNIMVNIGGRFGG